MARRKHNSNPISLFWFQDIITAVLGIMILVTLFLALEMIYNRQRSPDVRTRELTAKIREASAQAQRVETTVAATRKQIDDLRKQLALSETDLLQSVKYDSQQLQRQLRDLEELNRLLGKELSDADSQRRAAETDRDELTKKDSDRAADRQTLEQLAKMVQEKLEELRRLRAANRVIFNIGQQDAKTPWLVELSPSGVLAAPAGKRARPESFADVKAFLTWARQRSRSGEYFVLLVKPATIQDFAVVRTALEKAGYDVGFDLLQDTQTAIDPVLGAAAP